jgi:hypothetical protein
VVTSTERMGYAMPTVSVLARGIMAADTKPRRQVAQVCFLTIASDQGLLICFIYGQSGKHLTCSFLLVRCYVLSLFISARSGGVCE